LVAVINAGDDRLDEYLTGLFWITVFGLGLILGGLALIKQVLNLGDGLVIGYAILSSAVFLINFGLNLKEILRILNNRRSFARPRLDTNELEPVEQPSLLEARPSVTENTTSELQPAARDKSL
jgi:hypothetical protein